MMPNVNLLHNLIMALLCAGRTVGAEQYTNTYRAGTNTCPSLSGAHFNVHPGTPSVLSCARKCSRNTECSAFMYHGRENVCDTIEDPIANVVWGGCDFHSTFAVKTVASGEQLSSKLRQPCVTSADCITPSSGCYQSVCGCIPGYSYNPSNDACVTSCMVYGTTFQTHEKHLLDGFNDITLTNVSLNECMEECVKTMAFICRTAEYMKPDGPCYLSVDTALTQPTYYVEEISYVFMQRDCAEAH